MSAGNRRTSSTMAVLTLAFTSFVVSAATQVAFAQGSSSNSDVTLGPSAFTVPGAFPTSVYSSYYNDPTQTSAQVQPVISDPVTVSSHLCLLTNMALR